MFFLVNLLFLLRCPYSSISVANLQYFETLTHVSVTSSIKRAADGSRLQTKHINFRAFERQFDLTVKPGTRLMAKGFQARLINEDGKSRRFHFHNQIFSGHLSDRPDVRVHVHKEEALWSVQIFDHDNIYMLEPAWRLLTPAENPKNDTLIAYRASDMISDSLNSSHFCGAKARRKSYKYKHLLGRHRFVRLRKHDVHSSNRQTGNNTTREKRRTKSNMVCDLYLVGDYTFYKGKCNGNHVACTALMFASINFVDHIYTTSPFEISQNEFYSGIGMQIREINIYRTFTKAIKLSNLTHFNANISWTAGYRLSSFGYFISYLTYKKPKYCAHHLFTDYPHPDRILGIAWTEALCYYDYEHEPEGPGFVKQNCALSSGTDNLAGDITTLQMNLVIAHGHVFGSQHDASNSTCSHPEEDGGNFIMWSRSVTGRYYNNLKFSPCSLRVIGLVLQDVSCLVPRKTQFCGNGAIEETEHCDAGALGMANVDMCCDQFCKLRPNATCSDANFLCCKNCKMAPAKTLCLGAEPAMCTGPSYCTGHDYYCPEPALVANGTPCPDLGHCYNGVCSSFCSRLSIIKNVRLQGCLCRTNDLGAACKMCCFNVDSDNASETCQVFSTKTVKDGTPCYMGFCKAGVCESHEVTTIQRIYRIIPQIRTSELTKFMKDHLVMCVILISLIVWLPPTIIVYRADKANKQQLTTQGGRNISWHRDDPPLGKTSVVVGPQLKYEDKPESVIADSTHPQSDHGLSGSLTSVISSLFCEASKLFTGGKANSDIPEVAEIHDENVVVDTEPGGEIDSIEFNGSDKGGNRVSRKMNEGKVQTHVMFHNQNYEMNKVQSDVTRSPKSGSGQQNKI